MRLQTLPQPGNFSNGEWPGGHLPESPWPAVAPTVILRRVLLPMRPWWARRERLEEQFELLLPINYCASLGPRTVTVTVPPPNEKFTTDLASVPSLLTWLVPKSGAHLPAALIHDGLIPDRHG